MGGKGGAVTGGAWAPGERLDGSFPGGTTNLAPDVSWVSALFPVVMFSFYLFFFLFKRSTSKTTWEVCLVWDHFTNPTILSKAEQRQASRHSFLVMETKLRWSLMSVEEEEHSGAAATSSEGCGPVRVWAQEPLPPLLVVCTDCRISTSWASPCWSGGRRAEDGRRGPSAPSLGTGSRRH